MEKGKIRERSGSVGMLEGMWKRKREEEKANKNKEEMDEIFQRCKKTQRSSGKDTAKEEGRLEGLLKKMMEESRHR